ncbi:28S ribosomal protein S18b, mitochondrial-like isoform X1 [Biomphalaria glabrata]|uniref:Small ribosomal subunit protein mS40 n=2 Tax=Biomphalaria glabrata TaxID=6526 RepID=A0A9W3BFS7_BIOGL|nr:28S ribosomal protein S18b, mitochondrial-like isoform X1 [Biomphalaria glabrata]
MAAPLKMLKRLVLQLQNPIVSRCRTLMLSPRLCKDEEENETEEPTSQDDQGAKKEGVKIIDVDTSIRYLNSKAFTQGYGDKPVWFYYRRNFKGQRAPPTRRNCKIKGVIKTASPCPICRDEYLVLDKKNTKLLEQFICPHSGEILDTMKTGLCQHQHKTLTIEIMKAWDEGAIEVTLPFRTYDYEDYKK